MQYIKKAISKTAKYSSLGLLVVGMGVGTTAAFAEQSTSSKGGIKIGSANQDFYFTLGGGIRADQTFFMGDSGSIQSSSHNFRSGALVKPWLDFAGGIGDEFTYTLGVAGGSDGKVSVEDAFITYKDLGENVDLSFGQVNPGFCLENTSSGKWTPFIQRSMPSTAFGACPGIGFSISKWGNQYTLVAAATQPKQGNSNPIGFGDNPTVGTSTAQKINKSDRWEFSARGTYAPILNKGENKIVQVGLSVHHSLDNDKVVNFTTNPEAKARITNNYLATGSATAGTTTLTEGLVVASHHTTYDLELSAQKGPWYGEVEYQKTMVKRTKNTGPNVSFDGWHAQVAYVLTGESRTYKESNGTFGKVVPGCAKGAWEIAARYSHINLNDKNVKGGKGDNISLGISYYANEHIRLMANYINSHMKKEGISNSNLNIIGFRAQVVF